MKINLLLLKKVIEVALEEVISMRKKYNPTPSEVEAAKVQISEETILTMFEQLIDSETDEEFASNFHIMIEYGIIRQLS